MSVLILKQRWSDLRDRHPMIQLSEGAKALKVSEAELLATGVGESCFRLDPDFGSILKSLPALGEVAAITANDVVVHEHHGVFGEPRMRGETAVFFRPEQDTRYFLSHWHHAFSVSGDDGLSLQFFDKTGAAVHKIHLSESGNRDAFQELTMRFRSENQFAAMEITPAETESKTAESVVIDTEKLLDRWRSIRDVHEGNRIIREFGNHRPSIFRALGAEFARPLKDDSVVKLLTLLASEQVPCMLFVPNHAAVQSFSGRINRLEREGPLFSVLDQRFKLRLQTELMGAVWHVIKPTADGMVNSISVFDGNDREVLIITDSRGRGQAESENWRRLLAT